MVRSLGRDRGAIFGAAVLLACCATAAPAQTDKPRLHTHQSQVEDVSRPSVLPIRDIKAMFRFVLESLPERVKVYPTENYYYFWFFDGGQRYAGNIRLDASNRDAGKINFAYSVDFTEWKEADEVFYMVLDRAEGVGVEKLGFLVYRVSFGGRSVIFELNDLSQVMPPPGLLGPDERFIGPIFDESSIRFFLVFNEKLKVFHYILDETAGVSDSFVPAMATDRIVVGKRTGFAFYRDHKRDRKILIGVFESNARVNSYYDGPFDQLPDLSLIHI